VTTVDIANPDKKLCVLKYGLYNRNSRTITIHLLHETGVKYK